MYRVLVPEGEIECASFERVTNGIELFDEEERFIAFIPYTNLVAVVNEDVYAPEGEDRSIY